MFWRRAKQRLSLRGKVLAVLLPGFLTIIAVELWQTRIDAIDASNAAFDRSLLGVIKSVEMGVSTTAGGLAVELPYRMFELFQLTASGSVYYRVATSDGLVEIGSPDLPVPEQMPALNSAVFYDATYLGEPVRVGLYLWMLEAPSGPRPQQHLVIQVAESVKSRQAFSRSFLLRSVARDAAVISLVGITLTFAITLMLRPVSRLAKRLADRRPFDLEPIGERDLPRDIQPLVDAMNFQLARSERLMSRQKQFIDDASHQLRTPLAVLHAQVGYAVRQTTYDEVHGALKSIKEQLEHATRSTNQLLTMARTEAVEISKTRFDIGELVHDVATRLLPLARANDIDFGIDVPQQPCACLADRQLMAEALANLAHNAISYAAHPRQVTLSVRPEGASCELSVVSSGPAVPDDVMARLGDRFVKGTDSRGAGLGLAIVKSIAAYHDGTLLIEHVEDPPRVVATIRWPCD